MNGLQAPGSGVGGRFGPYELRTLLGSGGMGEVYEAYDTVKERVVALKVLVGELADDPEYQIRFRRESQAAARLAEPHIIPIHDWGVIDGRLFIDMRLVQGTDLRTVLRNSGPLSPQRVVTVIEQIGGALDAAHVDGLVHRDVKPANILVTDADFAYLADFGIARHEGDTGMTRAGMPVGSYAYMAPERFDNGRITGRADVYSLACVLYECLTGAMPFPTGSMGMLIRAHLAEPPPRASFQRIGLPGAFDDVIACGMAKEPQERFATAGELAVAARAALKSAVRPTSAQAGPRGRSGEPAATPTATGSGPATGGIPSLVVRMPQRDDDGAPDPTTTLPTIIPGDPTSVRPTDTEYIPITEEEAPTEPASGGIRPFPDAHLFPDQQVHPEAAASREPDALPETGGFRVANRYPSEPRNYGGEPARYPARPDDTTRILGPQPSGAAPGAQPPGAAPDAQPPGAAPDAQPPGAVPGAPYPGEETTRAHSTAGAQSNTGAWWTAEVADRSGGPDRYGADAYDSEAHGEGGYGAQAYSAGAYSAEAYGPEAYSESPAPPQDPYQAAYEAGYRDSCAANSSRPPAPGPEGQRSRLVPILAGCGVFVLVVLLAILGTAFLGSDDEAPTAAEATVAATTPAAPSSSAPATTRTTTTTATTTTRAQLPAGAQPCTTASGGSAYGSAAVGTTVTSCGFAEAVRQAYLDPSIVSAEGEPVAVEAASPVTGQSYTLTCIAEDGLVTCQGGNNAVVYLY